jgi:hypothetical protein
VSTRWASALLIYCTNNFKWVASVGQRHEKNVNQTKREHCCIVCFVAGGGGGGGEKEQKVCLASSQPTIIRHNRVRKDQESFSFFSFIRLGHSEVHYFSLIFHPSVVPSSRTISFLRDSWSVTKSFPFSGATMMKLFSSLFPFRLPQPSS